MRRCAAIGLVLAAAAVAGPAAHAAPSLSPTGEADFPKRSFVLTLPSGTQARAGQVQVTENGAPVDDLKVAPVDASQRKRLGIVLAIDTSRSMSGAPVSEAFAAARAFALERNEEQPLGLVTFDSETTLAMPLTVDPFVIQQRLAQPPETRPTTHLYDGGVKAVDVIRDAKLPGGFVVVLSDGADFGSDATLSQLTAAARAAHVRIYTVGLRSPEFDPEALARMAESAGGTYTEAGSPGDLNRIYSELSAELSNAYVVRYESVAQPRENVDVNVDVRGVGSATTAYTSPRLGRGDAGGSDGNGWSSPVAVAIAVAVFAGLLGLALMTVLRRSRQTPRERVEEFVSSRPGDAADEEPTLTDRLASRTERSLAGSAWWERFSEAADIARMPWPAARLVTNALLIAGGAGLLVAAATGLIVMLVIGLVIAPLALSVIVRTRARRERRLFADQLADHLAVVGSSLRAGHSFPAALASGLDEAPEPCRGEFARAVADERLGVPLDEALEAVARRMDNRDVQQVALLALLQRESGADAAEMLDGVVATIRERQELRRTVRTLTAQGRLSRTILTALPVVVLLGLTATNPDYVDPLYHTSIGRTLLIAAVAMIIAGSLAIKRIVNFEV